MARITKTVARPRRTKTEVQQEFGAIRQEVKAAREAADAKLEEAAQLKEAEVRQATDGISVEGVVQRISALGLDINKALGGISERLLQEVDLLASLREAAALERKELERLHKIDVAATALDQLVQEHERRKEEFDREITEHRAAWEDEVRATERERKEQDENLKKQRQREIDEYEYKKALERRKTQEKYEEELKLQEKKNRETQEALERSWQQREAALKDREEELARLRKEAEEFPARLSKESQEGARQAALAADHRFEQQILILKKDGEAERRLSELQIKTLEETVSRQAAQLAALQKQVDEAKQQVQDIAVRAIEGASGARALAHINQIAMEQAKHRTPQG